MEPAAGDNKTELAGQFISALTIAVSTCSLYSKEHESVDESAKKVLLSLSDILRDSERLEVMVLEDDLVVNKLPIRNKGLYVINFLKRLKRKGISRVNFLQDITLSEIRMFIEDMSETGKEIREFPHIKTGIVSVRIEELNVNVDADDLSQYTTEQIDKFQEMYNSISPFKQLQTTGLEEIVVNFIVTFKKEANILKLLSPVKSYSEYTYTHATNVSVLSMFQAESLGIKGELLHNIGISALLHDVGKLFISTEVLNKKGALDEKEFTEIMQHPLYGAEYLARAEGLTELAPIAAFEHHIKYNGAGYPVSKMNGGKPHICSQIIAISDFFDALRSWRPYRKSVETNDILALIRKGAGREFNPFLVDNFAKKLLSATS